MQNYFLKMLLALFIICTVGSVHQVFSAEPVQEDMFGSKLTGDWNGERTKLAENGITIDIDIVQSYQGVLDGGLESDWKYGGSADYWLKFDFEKLGLWPGAFVELRTETQFGEFINSDTGSILAVNTDGFFPLADQHMTTLSYAVFTQFLSESFGFVVGKMDTLDGDNNHFAGSRGKENFMNENFIFNPATLRTAPYSAMGAGLIFLFPQDYTTEPTILSVMALGSNGQPDIAGWDDDFEDGTTYNVEYCQPTNFFNLPGKQLFGATYSNKDYSALDLNQRTILTSLLGFGTLPKDEGSWSGYYNFHQYLFTEEDDETQGFGIFGRYGIAEEETSPLESFYSIGLGGKGIIEGRDNDTFGIGYYYIRVSNALTASLEQALDDEQGFEVFYNIEVSPSVHFTPDIQIVNPARKDFSTAIIAGCRLKIDF